MQVHRRFSRPIFPVAPGLLPSLSRINLVQFFPASARRGWLARNSQIKRVHPNIRFSSPWMRENALLATKHAHNEESCRCCLGFITKRSRLQNNWSYSCLSNISCLISLQVISPTTCHCIDRSSLWWSPCSTKITANSLTSPQIWLLSA
jgi:hypothetical protein